MIPRHRPEFGIADLVAALLPGRETVSANVGGRTGRTVALWAPSGRAALAAALVSVGARRAIVPAFDCWAVIEGLRHAGSEPMYVEIGEDLNADPDATLAAIARAEPGTVLLLTHQFGIPQPRAAELAAAARARGLAVVEDGAAAFGAVSDAGPVGSVGDVSILSFQYTKTVIAGDGGLVLAHEPLRRALSTALAATRAAPLRDSGRAWLRLLAFRALTAPPLYRVTVFPRVARAGSWNVRDADETPSLFRDLPAPWMRRLAARTLARSDHALAARRTLAARYLEGLADTAARTFADVASPLAAPIRFPLLVPDRARFIAAAARRGLDLGRSFGYTCSPAGAFPVADAVAATIVNLPLSARLLPDADRIVAIARAALDDAT